MKCNRRIAAGLMSLTAGLMLATSSVNAQQSSTTGTIRGRVTTTGGQPVPGAQITARNVPTGVTRGTLSDADGRYAIPLLQPGGPYTVAVTSIGYRDAQQTDVMANSGSVTPVNFLLEVQAVRVNEISVVASAPRVDIGEGGVATRVGTAKVENLPVAGRDFTDFLNLSPLVSPQPGIGTGGQFSVAGARTSGTNVQIDGADANNIYFGENRGSSRSPFAFSLESIKEFQLITNGYDVEYGNYQGGVVNAVTKTGTNTFGGTAFYYRREQGLTAKDFNDVKPAEYNVHQFGASASGPIMKDKLHFFASADLQRKSQPIYASVPVSGAPTLNGDSLAKVISALQSRYGVTDASSLFGTFSQDQNNTVLFGRIDWTLNDKHRLTLRQNYSDFTQTNDRLSATEAITNTGPFKDKVYSTVGELNSVFRGNMFNTLRFQYSYEDRPRPPSDKYGWLPQINIAGVGNPGSSATIFFGGDGVIFRNRLEENKLQLIDNFNYRYGMHGFKLGGNVLMGSNVNTFWNGGNGTFVFNSLLDFQNGVVNRYTRNLRACPVAYTTNAVGENVICPQYDVPLAEFDYTEYALYAQDDIQLTDKLLVTAGLRYSGTTYPDEPVAIQMVQDTFGRNTSVLPSFTGWSPRLSFTLDLGEQERVIRGGIAMLVGRAPTVLAGNAISTERTILSLSCTAAGSVPTLNQQTLAEMIANTAGERNPAACRSGAALTGRPEYTMFSEDFELPKTLKASIGYEHLFKSNTKLAVDGIYSKSTNQFTVKDLNLGARVCQGGATASVRDRSPDDVSPCFVLNSEANRPVYAPRSGTGAFGFSGTNGGTSTAERSDAFGRNTIGTISRTYLNESDGEAESYTGQITVEQDIARRLNLGVGYAYVHSYDNSSFSCCTSNEGFSGEATASSPNLIGDIGDDDALWGPSRFERRHTVTANFLWRAPYGVRLNGIWRSQSGTPFTPVVNGDVNGDGQAFNDRAMISHTLQWNDPAVDPARLDTLMNRWDCLREQRGRIATRNSCRNPWWHSLDLRLAKEIHTVRGQRAELLVDLFNVLNGLNKDWGRYMQVTGFQTDLLTPRRFDATTGAVVYSVNWSPATPASGNTPARAESGFGVLTPVGFDPYQFQAQIGVRYRF
jgi:hypothetical protein